MEMLILYLALLVTFMFKRRSILESIKKAGKYSLLIKIGLVTIIVMLAVSTSGSFKDISEPLIGESIVNDIVPTVLQITALLTGFLIFVSPVSRGEQ